MKSRDKAILRRGLAGIGMLIVVGAGLGVAKDKQEKRRAEWMNTLRASDVNKLSRQWMQTDVNEYALIDWNKVIRVDFTPNRDSASLMVASGTGLKALAVVNAPQTLQDLQQLMTAPNSTWVPVIVHTDQPADDVGGLYVDLSKVVNVEIMQPTDNGSKNTPILSVAGPGAVLIHTGSVYDQIAARKVYQMIGRS